MRRSPGPGQLGLLAAALLAAPLRAQDVKIDSDTFGGLGSHTASCSGSGGGAELFISEYVEGSSNNKALEIYNPNGTSVSLTGYTVEIYANGSISVSSTVTLSAATRASARSTATWPVVMPNRARASTTRAARSGVLGSIIAL